MWHGCVYKGNFVVDCHAIYLQHFIDQWKLPVYKLNQSICFRSSLVWEVCTVYIFHTDIFIDVSLMRSLDQSLSCVTAFEWKIA